MFDNSTAPSLELLRLRPDFASAPGFEAALRERVRRLREFKHPAFARVRRSNFSSAGGPGGHLELHARSALRVLEQARGPARDPRIRSSRRLVMLQRRRRPRHGVLGVVASCLA
jgi:hypothetical protein